MNINLITSEFPEAGELVSVICISDSGRTFSATGTVDDENRLMIMSGPSQHVLTYARNCRMVAWFHLPDCHVMNDAGHEFEDIPF